MLFWEGLGGGEPTNRPSERRINGLGVGEWWLSGGLLGEGGWGSGAEGWFGSGGLVEEGVAN